MKANKDRDNVKKLKNRLLKMSRSTVALLLLSSHLLPSVVTASAEDFSQEDLLAEEFVSEDTPTEIELDIEPEEAKQDVQNNTSDANDGVDVSDIGEENDTKDTGEVSETQKDINTSVNSVEITEESSTISNLNTKVATQIPVAPIARQSEETNLLRDGDFENTNPSNSVWRTKNATAGYELEGNQVGHIGTGTHDAFLLQVIDTIPGHTYTYTADVYVSNVEGNNIAGSLFTTKQVDSTGEQGPVLNEISLSDTENEWEEVSLEFTAETDQTFIGLVKWADADNEDALNTQTFIDNAVVVANDVEPPVEENVHYDLIWEDNFVTKDLNQEYWGYELGNIRGNEQQHYTSSKDNVYIKYGNLVLQITDRPEEDQYRNTERLGDNARLVKYNSGSVRTHGKLDFLYGRIEARMRLPKGKGAFPAFWTLGSDFPLDGRISADHGYGWPNSGEIDIMELIGAPTAERAAQGESANPGTSNQNIFGTAHFYYEHVNDIDGDGAYGYIDSNGNFIGHNIAGNLTKSTDYNEDFHTFGINWSPDKIEWYVDDIVYNTLTFEDPNNPDNQARLDAAKMAFSRPQYIQLNLAAGGNWPGDAGDYLGVDETKVEIDWVRWYQNEEQQQAATEYYANAPQINGAEDVTMVQGEAPNLLENVSTNLENFTVDFSIEDEYMFENSNGRNEVTLLVEDSSDIEGLQNLAPGVYNIHYSAFPMDVQIQGQQYPEYSITRETVVLTVLPNELVGVEGEPLSTVDLPEGMTWVNPDQSLGSAPSYNVIFRQLEGSGTTEGNERRVFIEIPDSVISRETPWDNGETPIEEIEQLENRIEELEEIVLELEGQNQELLDELATLLEQLAALRLELDGNLEELAALEGRVAELEVRVAELEEQSTDEPTPGQPDDNDELSTDDEPSNDDDGSSREDNNITGNDETSSDDTSTDKATDTELPKTGQRDLFSVVLGGLALVIIGGIVAVKSRKGFN